MKVNNACEKGYWGTTALISGLGALGFHTVRKLYLCEIPSYLFSGLKMAGSFPSDLSNEAWEWSCLRYEERHGLIPCEDRFFGWCSYMNKLCGRCSCLNPEEVSEIQSQLNIYFYVSIALTAFATYAVYRCCRRNT